jgi:hypothetical protein
MPAHATGSQYAVHIVLAGEMAMKRILVVIFTFGALCVSSLPALADGNGAQTTTMTFKDQTQTFPSANPCTGEPAVVTVNQNGVIHVTVRPGGTFDPVTFTGTNFSVTGTFTGTFMLVSATQTFQGHFATWFGFNDNQQNEAGTVTFNAVGRSTTDSTMIGAHTVSHINTTPTGEVNTFMKLHCSP